MAVVDSLLRLIVIRNAELLVLASGEVPILRKAGEATRLSMPPLEPALVTAMAEEVLDDAARARLAEGEPVETVYRLGDTSVFALSVEPTGGGYRMACRPGPAAAIPVGPSETARSAVESKPALPHDLARLLDRAESARSSDLLLSAGQPPRLRIAGDLVELDEAPCTDAQIRALLASPHQEELDRSGSTDAALVAADGTRYRLAVFRQRAGLAAALRPIRRTSPTLAELHLPEDLHELTRYPSGLVLVTGRAGSGKSTTLVALIEHLNHTRSKHVITLEDPIEYEYTPRRCLIHQREVGAQVESFAGGLRAALRESPDVILVGEMRDRETAAAALTAAETGHLVLSTMHCASAAAAVDRMIDLFPDSQQQQVRLQLSTTLRAVLTQALVPSPDPPLRYPAYEKMLVTPPVAAQIRDGKVHQLGNVILTSRDEGMVPFDRTLAALVRAGKVTRAAAREVALDPASLP